MLGTLVRGGMLQSDGSGRGMVYFLPWQRRAAARFDLAGDDSPAPAASSKPPELAVEPPELGAAPLGAGRRRTELGVSGVAPTATHLDWDAMPQALQLELAALGQRVSSSSRAPAAVLRQVFSAGVVPGAASGLARIRARALGAMPTTASARCRAW